MLNLFLIAYVGGQALRPSEYRRPMLTTVLSEIEARLPADDAIRFRTVIERDAPRYRAAASELANARQNIDTAIIAEPFDPEALREAITVWRQDWSRFTGTFGATIVDALGQISPKGRRALVSVMQRERHIPPVPPR
ncbi:periplasmic heavy metal sensor [Acetobacteraceae bacterium KSS8]|uniref:Periplasmic heavy metal sensor n=1 Tax=Endosaccharibacter trunci TaxID=2812733 RepID=A0ABT1W3X7_9PROT|nr:periplasmic heavy metal sensor [Acetobacteraceae bacterium KSS8]